MNNVIVKQDTFAELDNINVPTTTDSLGIVSLNYNHFLTVLRNRSSSTINTTKLIPFINSLGKNKSGGNNAIARLQYFLNAYIQEISLKSLNNPEYLEFIGQDHYSLFRGYPGTDDPDFYFYTNNDTYTIDVKIFYSKDTYDEYKSSTNFHKADYCLIYLVNTKSWRFGKKSENYSILYTAQALSETDPYLSEIQLPRNLTLIRFYTDSLTSSQFRQIKDKEVPTIVNYEFYV